ncbi:MAG TPA: RIP metalloprotease RseP [Candidatus Moranbacteria bacterium]|nr:RIP metalloprotease RseP [Candidatus Moranbacteria bacterium]
MTAVIVFILILSILIFVHELGHFTTAIKNGVKADEFGFGFPPRIFGFYKNEKSGRYQFVPGNKEVQSKNTVYSLNWIPLGGFVKIKGENGEEKKDPDSFASQSIWIRIKILAAGVAMNFVLAWALISVVFMLGAPQAVDPNVQNSKAKIQISEVVSGTPAKLAGLKAGDEILKEQANSAGKKIILSNVTAVQKYIKDNAGKKMVLLVKRGRQNLKVDVKPRIKAPKGQGLLGISLAETIIVKYPWYQALWEGVKTTWNLTIAILIALGGIIKSLFMGRGVGADVAGPVGIAILTKQVASLGLVYILQFAALLSINLGIINILPIPALDGGRILFVLIEKFKGSPVNQKVEQAFHSIGFALLILLLILITFRDITRL